MANVHATLSRLSGGHRKVFEVLLSTLWVAWGCLGLLGVRPCVMSLVARLQSVWKAIGVTH